MTKPTITVIRRGTTDTYQVKQTVDNMRCKIGDILSESELADIIDCRKYKVTIKDK
jgi:hypothetical protein